MARSLRELAKRIDEAGLYNIVEALPLLWRKSMVVHIAFRIGEIDFLVGNIEIATKYNWLALFHIFYEG